MAVETSRTIYIALQSTGILELSFDPSERDVQKALFVTSTCSSSGKMPGWLTSHRDSDKIYSISRLHYPDESAESGGLFAFRQRRPSKASSPSGEPGPGLAPVNERSSTGKGGVHIDVSPDGKLLAAANISGSTVSLFPVDEDSGAVGEPSATIYYDGEREGPAVNEGKGFANPHEARFDWTGRFLFVPLRSADKLDVYAVDGALGKLTKIHSVELPPKTGPRHTAIHRFDAKTSYCYLLSEKDNTIRAFELTYGQNDSGPSSSNAGAQQHDDLRICLKQTISLLETQPVQGQRFLGAEVAASNDGKFLYASNRFYPVDSVDGDTLSIYRINPGHASSPSDGNENHLTYIGSSKVLGHSPRMFALSNDETNRFVAVANAYDQEIVVFERDLEKGFLKDVRGRVKLGENDSTLRNGPVCVLWK
ncbi:uncharacterized protein A1O9_08312 [Exophiala aquamarina CBS 119918]|uniref:6-phosphogluconolactonase n=1 Tax=Exophiala aquamarina CBS 119918 TaxID=1182545 RepID=A0A072P760_9EURO|nr:uncharacterized protein A1O9_08312 [Exophiala aquamarina CBS 119918]KEF55562.1 hypothetical protein A1O9_08312 [Exophiala aquamarina CBS 119918]